MWVVNCHSVIKRGTYADGNQTRFWSRKFDDQPSAHRWAKEQVETGEAATASVKRL